MPEIDEKIVSIKFNNAEFERRVGDTIASVKNLKDNLKFDGLADGFSNIANEAKKITFDEPKAAIKSFTDRFIDMKALVTKNVATMVADLGAKLAAGLKSFSLDPIIDGFSEYELQLNSVQTILANTASKGENIQTVNAALDELNQYADLTIYNFGEMTKNIGTFTSAGVGLKDSVTAIKGISNLAALSGSNSQQASTAMYQLSQAMASGTVKLMDWNSVVNAGMGGEVFQKSLQRTAEMMGTNVEYLIKKNGSFRESLQEGWITSEVMLKTLATFTGDLTEVQLRAMGYTAEQTKAIMDQATAASDAATKFKTFSQVVGAAKEGLGSGWATTWQLLVGNFEEAKELWSAVGNWVTNAIDKISDARNRLLLGWKDLGGRTQLIQAFGNVFNAILKPIQAVSKAFKSVFSGPTSKGLYDATVALTKFTEKLVISNKVSDNITATFKALFSIVKLFGTTLGQTFKLAMAIITPILNLALKLVGFILDKLLSVIASFAKGITGITTMMSAFKGADKIINLFNNTIGKLAKNLMKSIEASGIVGKTMDFLGRTVGAGAKRLVEWIKSCHLAEKASSFFSNTVAVTAKKGLEWVRTSDFMNRSMAYLSDNFRRIYKNSSDWVMGLSFVQRSIAFATPYIETFSSNVKMAADRGIAFTKAFVKDFSMAKVKTEFSDLLRRASAYGSYVKENFNPTMKRFGNEVGVISDRVVTFAKAFSKTDAFGKISPYIDRAQASLLSFGNNLKGKISPQVFAFASDMKNNVSSIDLAFRSIFTAQTVDELTLKMNTFSAEVSKMTATIVKYLEPLAKKVERKLTEAFAIVSAEATKQYNRIPFAAIEAGFKLVTQSVKEFGIMMGGKIHSGFDTTMTFIINKTREAKAALEEFSKDVAKNTALALKGFGDKIGEVTLPVREFLTFENIMKGVTSAVEGLKTSIRNFSNWYTGSFKPAIKSLGSYLASEFAPAIDWMKRFLTSVGLLNAIKIGGGIAGAASFLKFMKDFREITDKGSIKGVLGALTNFVDGFSESTKKLQKAMAQNLKAQTVMKFAITIAILAGSLLLLSAIPQDKLLNSVATLVALTAVVYALSKVTETMVGGPQTIAGAASLMLVVIAIGMMGKQVAKLGEMDVKQLRNGLIAVTVLGAVLMGMYEVMNRSATVLKKGQKVNRQGYLGFIAMAAALYLAGLSVAKLGALDTEQLVKGTTASVVILGAMAGVTNLTGSKVKLGSALSLLALADALMKMTKVVEKYALMPWDTFMPGIIKSATVLSMMVAAVTIVPNDSLGRSAALLLLAVALNAFGITIGFFAAMPWATYLKGVVLMAATLGVLAGAMKLMDGKSFTGAAGLIAAAFAINLLVPAILAFGNTDPKVLAIGIVALAAALAVLVIAGKAATGVGPGLLLLSASVLAFGLAIGIASAGIGVLAIGLTMLAASGAAVIAVLIGTIVGIAEVLPFIVTKIGEAFIALLGVLAQNGETIKNFITMLLKAILDSITASMPNIEALLMALMAMAARVLQVGINLILNILETTVLKILDILARLIIAALQAIESTLPAFQSLMTKIIDVIITVLEQAVSRLIEAGINLILGLLRGIRDNIYEMVTVATEIVVKFLQAIGDNAGKIADEGAKMVVNVINGIAGAIERNAQELRDAGARLGWAIIDGITGGLGSRIGNVSGKLQEIAGMIPEKIAQVLGIRSPSRVMRDLMVWVPIGMAKGMEDGESYLDNTLSGMGAMLVGGVKDIVQMTNDEMDLQFADSNFVIAPLVDLTNIRTAANEVSSLLTMGGTASMAAVAGSKPATYGQADNGLTNAPASLVFNQTINSPKAVSPVEVYRNTKNGLSQVREVLQKR